MKIELRKGDIAEIEADVLVNAAGTSLVMGGGVAGALRRKGGEIIQKEALKKAPIGLGEAVATTAGNLKAKYVIHAAAMPHYGNRKATEGSIKDATYNALRLADELKCKSIAIPALGCGIAGFPVEKGAQIIVDTIRSFKPKNLEKAILVLYTKGDYKVFEEEIRIQTTSKKINLTI